MEDRNLGINLNEFSTADHDFFSNNFSYEETFNEILIVTVELADEKKAQVVVHENENLEQLVVDFGEKYDLGPKARGILMEEIERNLQMLYPEPLSRLPESVENEDSKDQSIKFEIPNKGHDLYNRGVKMREKVKKKIDAIRNENKAKEMKSTTFRPATNSPGRRNKPPEQILLEKGKQTIENLQRKRQERDTKALDPCTFSPEINKNSSQMKKSRQRSPGRYLSLYQDAQNIREKLNKKSQELVTKNCPFEPNFSLSRKKTSELISKAQKDNKNLYSPSKTPEKTKQQQYKPSRKGSFLCTGRKSEQMIQKIRHNRYKEIFCDLLPDTKNLITRETVYKAKLQPKMREMLRPLLEELESYDEKLNFKDFCDAMEILMKSLSQAEKTELMKMPKNTTDEEFDFSMHRQGRKGSASVTMFAKCGMEESTKPSPSKSHKSSFIELPNS